MICKLNGDFMKRNTFAAVALLLLTACGGGGGGCSTGASSSGASTQQATVDPCAFQANPFPTYPSSYSGSYTVDEQAAKLDTNINRMVGLKDYYPGALENSKCPSSDTYARAAYANALDRLKADNTDTVWIVNYGNWDDFRKSVWTMTTQLQVPDDTVKYVITEAHKRGMKVYLGWQFGSADVASGTSLPMLQAGQTELDYAQIVKMLDSWQGLMKDKARLYGDAGLDGLQIDFHAFFVGTSPSYKEFYKTRMLEIIADVKKVYSGKITYGAAMPDVDSNFVGKIDYYEIPDRAGVNLAPLAPLTVAKLKVEYKKDILNKLASVPAGIPVLVSSLIQSKSDFYEKNWTEDGFCVDSTGAMTSDQNKCVQLGYVTDFSLQAMGTEAVLQAVNDLGSTKISAINFNTGYWLTDNLTPFPSFPNLSQSLRNKPAEAIVKKWFAR